jgi:TolB-like protein
VGAERVERRLMAILAADVAGYGRLVGADDEGTLAQWKAHFRELIEPKIAEHHGRIVRITGDGLLVEFVSVIAALKCAVEVQHGMGERNIDVPQEKRIEFRMGINVGDIIIDGTDIWGDGVNLAARLEALSQPGGICVSARVQEDADGRLDIAFEDMGEQQLKNIARPTRVYRVRLDGRAPTPAPALPDKPSIAVLPFNNMSGDPEQEYFADGMVEEIITALSRIHGLFVIARNSSFTYKGRAVDVKQVGRELGVRYVLEGGVRKAGNRLRITGQLIDATTGMHLWADRFDGSLDDIFDLQDRVAASVVGAIAPQLENAEIARAKRKPTGSLDAYDYYLRGIASLNQEPTDRKANSDALRLFLKAIELDPDFAAAYGMAAWCCVWRKANGWVTDRVKEFGEAERLARRAVALGKDDAVALARGGHALAYVVGEFDAGKAFTDQALLINPNFAVGWMLSGLVSVYRGEPDEAVKSLASAVRLSPLDPLTFVAQTAYAMAYFFAGNYEEALSWAEKVVRDKPNYQLALRIFAAANALTGRQEEAQQTVKLLRQLDPELRISNLKDRYPLRRAEDLARWADGLRIAGVPE